MVHKRGLILFGQKRERENHRDKRNSVQPMTASQILWSMNLNISFKFHHSFKITSISRKHLRKHSFILEKNNNMKYLFFSFYVFPMTPLYAHFPLVSSQLTYLSPFLHCAWHNLHFLLQHNLVSCVPELFFSELEPVYRDLLESFPPYLLPEHATCVFSCSVMSNSLLLGN